MFSEAMTALLLPKYTTNANRSRGAWMVKQIDKVIDVVGTLCYNHEMSGFTEGVKVGVQMADELGN